MIELVHAYGWLVGDVRFVVGEADLSAAYGWVPVLDFAVCLRRWRTQLLP